MHIYNQNKTGTNLVNDAQRREEQAYQDSHVPVDRREHVVQREISKGRYRPDACELGLRCQVESVRIRGV